MKFCKVDLRSLAILFFFLSFDLYSDDFLKSQLKKFKSAKTFNQKENLSSEVFLIGKSSLKSGNSSKAIQYFKVAMQMTPRHSSFIQKEVDVAINNFIETTLVLPKENCKLIRERFDFLKVYSPDKSINIITKYENCFQQDFKLNNERIEKLKNHISNIEEKIKSKNNYSQKINKELSNAIEELRSEKEKLASILLIKKGEKTKDILEESLGLKLPKIPKRKIKISKSHYQNLYISAMDSLYMESYEPYSIITNLQLMALELIKIETKKPKLKFLHSNLKTKESLAKIEVPIKLKILRNKKVKNILKKSYVDLLDYETGKNVYYFEKQKIRVSDKVSSFISMNQPPHNRQVYGLRGKRDPLPIFPPVIILDIIVHKAKSRESGPFIMSSLVLNPKNIFNPDLMILDSDKVRKEKLYVSLPVSMVKGMKRIEVKVNKKATRQMTELYSTKINLRNLGGPITSSSEKILISKRKKVPLEHFFMREIPVEEKSNTEEKAVYGVIVKSYRKEFFFFMDENKELNVNVVYY